MGNKWNNNTTLTPCVTGGGNRSTFELCGATAGKKAVNAGQNPPVGNCTVDASWGNCRMCHLEYEP